MSWGAGYTVEVGVGTPPQKFDMLVDTGSDYFWVIGTCDDATDCGNSSVFRSAASSTFQPTGMPFNISYLDGGLQRGYWGFDQVSVGGQTLNSSVGVSNETVGWGWSLDGIMGFMNAGHTNDTKPWWMNALGEWAEPVFGMYMAPRVPVTETTPDKHGNVQGLPGHGELTLG
jgi:hypothetical protein